MTDGVSAQPPVEAPTPVETPIVEPPTASEGVPPGSSRSAWHELPVMLLIALVIAILIKSFLVQAFFIPSPSMEPVLQRGDRILVCRICLRVSDIERGDVMVFSDPHPDAGIDRGLVGGFLHWLGEGVGVAQPQDEDFIKRVAALPGQTWEIRDGRLYIDGARINEPYLKLPTDSASYGPETVPDGMLFMLGDNRLESGDSRFQPPQGLGYVPIDTMIGQAFLKIWPLSRTGGIR
ncbi:MAG: signal peptidase I [Actinomycetota bacterium]